MTTTTDWKTRFESKQLTLERAIARIPRGKYVFIGSGATEPVSLVAELCAHAGSFADNTIMHLLTLGPAPYVEPQYASVFRHNAFFIGPNVREAVADGRADYTPVFLSQIPELMRLRRFPIDVALVRAKRTVYTASVYVSTDTGPGGKVGFERRWLNSRGHKLSAEAQYSTRLEDYQVQYRIPKPGRPNRNWTLGVGYRDEETDSSTSRMARAAATEVTDRWKGFTRTLGLQYLNGDFEIAHEQHSTSLLYAEGTLTRKKADDLYFPLSGYNLLYGLRVASESLASDTSFVQARAEAKWLRKVGEDGRVILSGLLGAMAVDDFAALPPELRFFAGGDRSIRGFDYQQIGDLDAALGEVDGPDL